MKLKENKIYDNQNIQYYNNLFRCLSEKNKAFDFLFSLIGREHIIYELKDKIQSTDELLNINDIINTKKLVYEMEKMIKLKDNDKRLIYAQSMNKEND